MVATKGGWLWPILWKHFYTFREMSIGIPASSKSLGRNNGNSNKMILRFISLLFFLFAVFSGSVAAKTGREHWALLGNVHSILINEIDTIPGKANELVTAVNFDRKGNVTETLLFFSGPEGSQSGKTQSVFTYHPQEHFSEQIVYSEDGSINHKVIHIVDGSGNETGFVVYAPDGTLNYVQVFIYDFDGNKSEMIAYHSDGKVFSRSIEVRDGHGYLIERTRYRPDGSVDSKYTYEQLYDQSGNRVQSAVHMPDGSQENVMFDKAGNPTTSVSYDASGQLSEREIDTYEFDLAGNWTKRKSETWVNESGKLVLRNSRVTFRTIGYFD